MDKNTGLKAMLIFIGVTTILLFLGVFLQSRSPLDLLYITIGIMTIIWGFYIEGEKFNETAAYFVVMFGVNLLQWLIFIYIVFSSQIHITLYILIVLAIAPGMTIILINQLRRSDLKYLGNRENTNKDVILIDKMKSMSNDKTRFILIFVGIVIMVVSLTSFSQSRSPLELFGSSVGVMVIIWGYYREGKKDATHYSPGMSRGSIYRESKKINVTTNYFFAMASVLVFQWLIICYIAFIHPSPVPDPGDPIAVAFALLSTMYFYIQIRESDLKIKISWAGIFIGNRKIF